MKERFVYSATKAQLDNNPKEQELTQVASLLSFVGLGRYPSTTTASPNLKLGSLLQFPDWITSFTQRCPPGNSNDIDGKEVVAIGALDQINFDSSKGEQQSDPEHHESRHDIDVHEENEKPSNDFPSCNDNSDKPKVRDLSQKEIDNRVNECDQALSDRELLRKHVREQRCGTNQTYSCPNCEFTSQKNDDIKKHKLSIEKEKGVAPYAVSFPRIRLILSCTKKKHMERKRRKV